MSSWVQVRQLPMRTRRGDMPLAFFTRPPRGRSRSRPNSSRPRPAGPTWLELTSTPRLTHGLFREELDIRSEAPDLANDGVVQRPQGRPVAGVVRGDQRLFVGWFAVVGTRTKRNEIGVAVPETVLGLEHRHHLAVL